MVGFVSIWKVLWKFWLEYCGILQYIQGDPREPDVIKINSKKGKAFPLQTWSGPEGSRKLRFPDLLTTTQYGG
jgi:hypothetical protein